MPLPAGSKLGPYEIQGAIGAGGMGEVYRARDTRLDRTVAIKILPSDFSTDPASRQRFEREARAISSLQHPHICVLHDIGRENGTDYLVMEYLEGNTLADRLARGPLPLQEALKIAGEIAEALAKAHEQGIVHRDLKPGNIMLSRSGAKLMDFGLAKLAAGGGGNDPAAAVTVTRANTPITAQGMIVGTFQYMAPEVLEGREADARSDMFSFGCVLYEMVTGRCAFDGKSRASVIAAVMGREPEPLSALQPMAPAALDRLVRACLSKEREERWQSAHDLQTELHWISRGEPAATPAERGTRAWLPWVAAVALAMIATFLGIRASRPQAPPVLLRSWLMPPSGQSFVPFNFAVSPDGNRLAFVAARPDGKSALWVRSLNTAVAQEITGSEDAQFPFWGPDSRRLAFFSHRKMQIVDLQNGQMRSLAEAEVFVGGTWSGNDVILFAPGPSSVLYQIPAGGGTPTAVTRLPREGSGQAHRWPFFLPDGRHFLFFADWSAPEDPGGNGLYVGSLDGGDAKLISPDITGNVEYFKGRLFYFRDRSVVAQPFDAKTFKLTGNPVPLTDQGVEKQVAFSKAGFSASPTGMLVFEMGVDSPSRMTWFDASGHQIDQFPQTGNRDPRLSPDGHFLAVTADEAGNGRTTIAVYDLARGLNAMVTSGGSDEFPIWSPDGRTLLYSSQQGKTFYINRIPLDGSKPPEAWLQGPKMIANSFTPDGRYFAMMNLGFGGSLIDIISTSDKKLVQRFRGAESQFSFDGHWIAYTFPNGEMVVQAFPGPGPRFQISNGGGAQPRWSHDSSRLYYIAPDKRLMMVHFDPAGKRPPSAPQAVIQTRILASHFAFIQWDISPDGTRFLINSLPPGGGGPLSLISDWTAALPH